MKRVRNTSVFWLSLDNPFWRISMNIDFDAHKNLDNTQANSVEIAIQQANKIAHKGDYVVCKTSSGIQVLPEFSANVRKDVEAIYSTVSGFMYA